MATTSDLKVKVRGTQVTVRTKARAKVAVSRQDAAARAALPGAKLHMRAESMHDGKPVESVRVYRVE